MSKPIRIGLIGLGTVGTGVAQILSAHQERTKQRAGRAIEIAQVAVRDIEKKRSIELPSELLTTDPMQVATNPDVDVVVELIGGLSPAKELVEAALNNGKDVVTANKALL